MKVLGLVLELNPFHNGHEYFINEAKNKVNPDLTIAVISSSFAMRGEAMVMDKWEKAKICLQYGIDMVLELPFLGAVNSADYFCYNAIKILTDFNITDLAFGVEFDNPEKIIKMKEMTKSKVFDGLVKKYIDEGNSYGGSNLKALKELSDDEEIINNFSLPNNTLAIGYLNAIDVLNKDINITFIKRIANNYYDEDITDSKINSATSLRNLLENGKEIDEYIPYPNYNYLNPLTINDTMFTLLKYVFNTSTPDKLKNIYGMSEGIENRILSFINVAKSYDDLLELVKTKRYSKNRIRRLFLYSLMNIDKEHENKYHNYLRILSMNQKGKNYLRKLDKNIKASIITTFKNQNNYLVDIELRASKLYGLLINNPNIYLNEFNVPYIGDK